MRRKLITVVAAVVGMLAVAAAPAQAATSSQSGKLPVIYSLNVATAHAALHPDTAPPGSNDYTCKPSPAHPRPVVLVHGTIENMTYNFNAISPLLKNNGYCVFAFNYGQRNDFHPGLPGSARAGGTAAVASSASELAGFITRVRGATGASTVDIVGHSQGGMMPRYYLKFLNGARYVHSLVGLSPSNHGTTVDGLASIPGVPQVLRAGLGDSVRDQIKGSQFLAKLNAGGDTVSGVDYTVIETKYDEVVTPYQSAFLGGSNVHNILLQNFCALDGSEHLAISYDSIALRYMLNALDPAHPRAPVCKPVLPTEGG